MAHFAQLNTENLVLQVVVLDNSVMENEQGERIESLGVEFLQNLFGPDTIWKQTSYNTRAGIYYIPDTSEPDPDQSKAFRKNYAGIDYTFDDSRDAFINPKPIVPPEMEQYVIFDEFSCLWSYNPPIPVEPMEIIRV